MVIKYHRVAKSPYREVMSESQDCSVIALALTCRTDYKTAHDWLMAEGRGTGESFSVATMLRVAEENGFRVIVLDDLRQPNGSRYTPRTIGARLPEGYYLCTSRGHVFAVINGIVEDWTNSRTHRILRAHQIIHPRG
jgi:hypothetical protein